MDELIVLLIGGILRLLSGNRTPPPPAKKPIVAQPAIARPRPGPPNLPLRPVARRGKLSPPRKAAAVQPVAPVAPVAALRPAPQQVAKVQSVLTTKLGPITAASLRRQIVINEILLPPLALRPED